jgi:hypothetical protein
VRATTKGTGEQTIRSRKDELKEHFFGIGNYHATKDTLDAFLRDQEVKQLLPAGFSVLSKQDQIDAKATRMLLAAGKEFFTKLLVSNGRKSDVDRNVYLAAAASWVFLGFGISRDRELGQIQLDQHGFVEQMLADYNVKKDVTQHQNEIRNNWIF